MMISGFEWERNIARAGMSAGITKQILKYCIDMLIPKLEQRRFWAEAFNVLNAAGDEMLQQSLEDVHFFERLARKWKFVRDAENRVWKLHFVEMVEPPPEVDVDATEPDAGENGPAGDNNPRTMRPDDGAADGAVARVAVEIQPPRGAREILHQYYLFARPVLKRVRRTARVAGWMIEDALERIAGDLQHFCAALHLRRLRAAESLTAMVAEMAMVAACAPRRLAQLEFVRVRLGPNQTMELTEYRGEEPDWNAWLFGRPRDEDMVLQ